MVITRGARTFTKSVKTANVSNTDSFCIKFYFVMRGREMFGKKLSSSFVPKYFFFQNAVNRNLLLDTKTVHETNTVKDP